MIYFPASLNARLFNGIIYNQDVTVWRHPNTLNVLVCPRTIYEVKDRDVFRPQRGTLSIEKAKNLLGYQPDYDLEKGINEYVEFVKENNPDLFK